MADDLRPSLRLPQQRKYDIGAPLFIGRTIQPSGAAPAELPIGSRIDSSAPPRKLQVRFHQHPSNLILGIPVPQEYPAFLVTAGIGERRWPPGVDVYPNLIRTTFFVAPTQLPPGKQLLTMAPPRKFAVQVDRFRTDLVRGIPQVVPPALPLGLPVDTNQAKRKYHVVDLNYLWPNSQLPNTIPPPVSTTTPPSIYVGTAVGGGGTGLGFPRRNKGAEKFADIAELEVIVKKLTGETASYKMAYDTDKITSQFSDSEHPEVDEIDFVAFSKDEQAVSELMVIWKRYNEKRSDLFGKLRAADYDWDPDA